MMNLKDISKEQLNKLSPEEKKIALSILEQYAKDGSSDIFNNLVYSDYEEIPVDIETFLDDKNYLGNGTLNAEDKSTVFPYWRKVLKEIFPDNINTNYNTFVLTGAIGLGKSFIAVICILYMLYRMICLKDPYEHYGLQRIDTITFAFMNITLDAAEGVAWSKCQELLKTSPWFMSKGHMSRSKDNPTWVAPKGIELIYGSTPEHVIGRCLFACFEDEISFQRNKDIVAQKEKAKLLISSIDARMKSRFMKGEKLPTLNILASSKRTEQSFLESFIETKKRNESKTTLVVDEPQWVIRNDKDSPNKFCVAVGNKFLASEVLPLNVTNEIVDEYKAKGYTILKVPMGYYENFVDDLDIALTDIAGISSSNVSKYISGIRWNECVVPSLENPVKQEIIEVGNASNDTTQYYDFFDLLKIPQEMKSKPLFIHLDMSISGDKTGIVGVWIRGKRPKQENESQAATLNYQLAFSFAVKAPKGYQISFEKNKQFIYWLRKQGFSIKSITADTFQSTPVLQDLKAQGFHCDILSVDRIDAQTKTTLPYAYLKTTIYEKNIRLFKTSLLTEEIVNLERYENGRIEHPNQGKSGSKDCADSLAGAIYDASKYAEEYAYNYGESYDTFLSVNESSQQGDEEVKKQLLIDFENELKEMNAFPGKQSLNAQEQDTTNQAFIMNDILIW